MPKRRRINWIVSDGLRRTRKIWLELSAKLRGQRFYCGALSGESEYNITINCDSTLTCNCHDYNGSGNLGDLTKNTFSEVFFGAKAQSFRDSLAKGKLPIMTCAHCGDLKRAAKAKVAEIKPRLPYRGMLLENTVRCNIDCIGCDRVQAAGLRRTKQMELPQLAKMADLVHDLGLQQVFYLNLGEPFLSPNIGAELKLLREKNPDTRIVISSNAIILNTDAKRDAAMYASQIFFSIAGIDEAMLKKYEHGGNFEKAFENLKAIVAYRNARGLKRPILEWKYLLFNWNDKRWMIERAIEMAKEAGVDAISFWPTNNPFFGISWRYRLGMLNDIGIGNWKGREVDLRAVKDPPLNFIPPQSVPVPA
ncbi:MAG: hypothetical protein QOD03_601 [Verrucomicrobiota bacterium]|jgi:hypothetical protein